MNGRGPGDHDDVPNHGPHVVVRPVEPGHAELSRVRRDVGMVPRELGPVSRRAFAQQVRRGARVVEPRVVQHCQARPSEEIRPDELVQMRVAELIDGQIVLAARPHATENRARFGHAPVRPRADRPDGAHRRPSRGHRRRCRGPRPRAPARAPRTGRPRRSGRGATGKTKPGAWLEPYKGKGQRAKGKGEGEGKREREEGQRERKGERPIASQERQEAVFSAAAPRRSASR